MALFPNASDLCQYNASNPLEAFIVFGCGATFKQGPKLLIWLGDPRAFQRLSATQRSFSQLFIFRCSDCNAFHRDVFRTNKTSGVSLSGWFDDNDRFFRATLCYRCEKLWNSNKIRWQCEWCTTCDEWCKISEPHRGHVHPICIFLQAQHRRNFGSDSSSSWGSRP